MKKILSISLAPFVNIDRMKIAMGQIFKLTGEVEKEIPEKVKSKFIKYFPGKNFTLTGTGREALLAILQNLDLPEGSRVAVQGCTCTVIPWAVKTAGYELVWIDIDRDNFQMDLEQLRIVDSELRNKGEKINVVITQDTFGIKIDREEVKKLKEELGFIWIEDLAHSFGNEGIGNYGDYAFLSFGRDKMLSACSGGMIIHNGELEIMNYELKNWNWLDVKRLLLYEILMPFAKAGPVWWTKIWTFIFFKLSLLPKVVQKNEKGYSGEKFKPRGLPKNFLPFLEYELDRWEENVEGRKHNVEKYNSELGIKNYEFILLRYPLLVDNAIDILDNAKKNGIYLGDWYRNVVDPLGSDLESFGYKKGMLPVAEEICPKLINLPTNSWMNDKDFDCLLKLLK